MQYTYATCSVHDNRISDILNRAVTPTWKGDKTVEMEVVRQRIICCHKTFCLKCWGEGFYIKETRIKAEKMPEAATKETGSTDENR